MKLYVCYGTRGGTRHACGHAYDALVEAGYDPEVIKVRGFARGPRPFWVVTKKRREVERISDQSHVPLLVTDDGQTIDHSLKIVDWAKAHPAGSDSSAD